MGGSYSKTEKNSKHAQELGEKKGILVGHLSSFKNVLDRFNSRAVAYPISKIRKISAIEASFIEQAFDTDLKELTKIRNQVQEALNATVALEKATILTYTPRHSAQEQYLNDYGYRYVDFLAHFSGLMPEAERNEMYAKCVTDTKFPLSVGIKSAKSILEKRLAECTSTCQTLKESLTLSKDASAAAAATGPSDFGSPVSKATPEKDAKPRAKVQITSPESQAESSWGSVSEVSEAKESRAEIAEKAPVVQHVSALFAVKDSRAEDDFDVDLDADSRAESHAEAAAL